MTDALDSFWRNECSQRVGATGFVLEPDEMATVRVDGSLAVDVFGAVEPGQEDAAVEQAVVVRVNKLDCEPAWGVLVALVDSTGAFHEGWTGRLGRVVFTSVAPGPVECAVGGERSLERAADPLVARVARTRLNHHFDRMTAELEAVDMDAAMVALLEGLDVDAADAVLSRSQFVEPEVVRFGGPTQRVQRFPIEVSPELADLGDVSDASVTWRDRDRLVTIYCRRPLPGARLLVVLASGTNRSVALGTVRDDGHELVAEVPWPHAEAPTTIWVAVVPD